MILIVHASTILGEPQVAGNCAVDDLGESSFEAAQSFFVALTGSAFALAVDLSGRLATNLGDGHEVERVVEL
jgi:hypothetical protein